MRPRLFVITGAVVLAVAGAVAACGERAALPLEAGIGPSPALPAPNPTLLPTVNVATPPLPVCRRPRRAAMRGSGPKPLAKVNRHSTQAL